MPSTHLTGTKSSVAFSIQSKVASPTVAIRAGKVTLVVLYVTALALTQFGLPTERNSVNAAPIPYIAFGCITIHLFD